MKFSPRASGNLGEKCERMGLEDHNSGFDINVPDTVAAIKTQTA
jgi:hypothetical protein